MPGPRRQARYGFHDIGSARKIARSMRANDSSLGVTL